MLTSNFQRNDKGLVTTIEGAPVPEHLAKLRIPPAWTQVKIDPDPKAYRLVTARDAAGRWQMLYSPEFVAANKSAKFERVKSLLSEWEDIRTQIEAHLNDKELAPETREAALVAYLIYETGIRPGSEADRKAALQAYGATTLELRHVKPSPRGVRLKFIGKKGVAQNVLVTNPYLATIMYGRKTRNKSWSRPVFHVDANQLRLYFKSLGTGQYTPKDFRTARGTSLALEILGARKRIPKTKKARKQLVNDALDQVAKQLGNTRAISRKSYVDPAILERFLPATKKGE